MSHVPPTEVAAPGRLRGTLLTVAKIAISLGLIGALSAWIDWSAVGRVLRTARAAELTVAVGAIALTLPLSAWRWSRCGAACGVRLPTATYLRATYASLFVGQFLPSGIGVDAARTGYLVHQGGGIGAVLRSVALDRALGIGSIIFVLAAGLPWIWSALPMPLRLLGIGLVGAAFFGAAFLAFAGRLRGLADSVRNRHLARLIAQGWAVRDAALSRPAMLAFVVSVVMYCMMILGVSWIARSIGVQVPYIPLLAVASLAMFVALLPISINGWGVREGAMVAGLSALAVGREHALAVSLLFGAINAIVTLPGAFLWQIRRQARRFGAESGN